MWIVLVALFGALWMWQSGDESVTYWTPHGVTGSFDATSDGVTNGRKLLRTSETALHPVK